MAQFARSGKRCTLVSVTVPVHEALMKYFCSPWRSGWLAASVVLAVAVGSLGFAAAAPVNLAAHRAVYDISLLDAAESAGVIAVSGRLVVEFTGSPCAGYRSSLRFVTETQDPNGQSFVIDTRSSSFETADGSRLDFANETYSGAILAEESSGEANRDENGIAVSLRKPEEKKVEIDGKLVFPTDQMSRILTSALDGETFLSVAVYDGSEDGETVFETAGVIGPESTTSEGIGDEIAIDEAGMSAMRHWPVTLSYFDRATTGDDTPFYVLSFVIYENGVGRALKIDYGDFALAGKLTGLELLPSTPCP
ncbi:MAG: cell envelope integrity EipB family protein [Hyphomicrobiales bacterium]|nr:cell envelope integrity EipB family protein [Hyphomicrobiales bacterium]